MKTYYGIGNKKGSATAKLLLYKKNRGRPAERNISDAESEKSRFRLAKYIAIKELSLLYEKAYAELGEAAAMIFYIHQMMLEDLTFTDNVCTIIDEKMINSEAAVYDTGVYLADIFDGLDDGYIRARQADVFDICERVISILKNESRSFPLLTEPSVIASDDLSPSELLLPKRQLMAGIVLTCGSSNSHTAILADKMNIPMIVSLNTDVETLQDGISVHIDSDNGTLSYE